MVASIWFLLTFLATMLKTYGVIPARGTNIYFADEETEGQEGLTVKEDGYLVIAQQIIQVLRQQGSIKQPKALVLNVTK